MSTKIGRHIKTGIGTGRSERFCRLFDTYNIKYTLTNLNTILIEDQIYLYPTRLKVRLKGAKEVIEFKYLNEVTYYIAKSLGLFFKKEDIEKYLFTNRKKIKELEKINNK